MSGNVASPQLEDQIKTEKLSILFHNLLISIPTNFICSLVEFISLYSIADKGIIKSWLIAVIVISILRLFSVAYLRARPQLYRFHYYTFIVGTVLSAILWGVAASVLMPDESLLQQMVTVVLVSGVTAGGMQSLQPSFAASFLYIVIIILPLIIWLLLHSLFSYIILAVAMTTYLIFMIIAAWRGSTIITNSLKLRYENVDLVTNLQSTNETMQELNQKTQNILAEIQLHELEMSIINKMNELLQISQNFEEACGIIHHTSQQIFPELSGGLFIFDSSENRMHLTMEWGDQKILKKSFNAEDCWGLREGHAYLIDQSKNEILCHHFNGIPSGGTLCLPQIIPAGIHGLLVLVASDKTQITPYQQQLATNFNDVIKLSLANIKLRETLREQSIRDPLTGLFNRRYLNELLPSQLHRVLHDKKTLCVAMIDVDFFKRLNDTHGHEAGDQVLKMIGNFLAENFRGSDLACRFGGEEFIIILSDTNISQAKMRMEKVQEKISSTTISFRDKFLPQVTLSIGIAEAPIDGSEVDEIINSADKALYQAKNNGRNRIEIC